MSGREEGGRDGGREGGREGRTEVMAAMVLLVGREEQSPREKTLG